MASGASCSAIQWHLSAPPGLLDGTGWSAKRAVAQQERALSAVQGQHEDGLKLRTGCGAAPASLQKYILNLRNWGRKQRARNLHVNLSLCSTSQLCSRAFWSRNALRAGTTLSRRDLRPRQSSQLYSVSTPQAETADVAVQKYLELIAAAMGIQDYGSDEHMILTGKQLTWGMEGAWTMTWCMDGRFHEKFESEDFTHEWAYDGIQAWYADAGGRVQKQELDGHEVCLLVSWSRMGYWVTEDAQRRLDIQLVSGESVNAVDSELVLSLRMKNKKVVVLMVIDKGSWLPARMTLQAFGGSERWSFSAWQNILPDRSCKLPTSGIHLPPAGREETFDVVKVEAVKGKTFAKTGFMYSFPASSVVPRYNLRYPCSGIDSSCSSSIRMKSSDSGHFLVQPLVDGKSIGSFIVDTGASNLAISSRKAEELNMARFGEVYVSGVSGAGKSQYARGKTFKLGPFSMTDPAFLELPIDELVPGVVGICGYDIFLGCIVEMSVKNRTLSLFDPLEYEASPGRQKLHWQKMFLIEGVPHAAARINGQEVLLLIDTGAGGTDLMLYSEAAKQFNLRKTGVIQIKGINAVGMQVPVTEVDVLEVAGHTFRKVTTYAIDEKEKMFVCSQYCAGMLGGRTLQNFLMVFDYSRGRMALVDERSTKR